MTENLPRKNHMFSTVQYKDDEGNWRVRIISQRDKLDERAKGVFIEEYSKHGRMGHAAQSAGVGTQTIRRHMTADKDFGEACLEAEHMYRDRLIQHHQNLVFDGTTKKTYDRLGVLVSEEQVFPIRLIELELKKHDEGYRDKREVELKVTGGVLIAPPEVASVDDWEDRFSNNKVIDGEAEEVDSVE